MPARARQKIKLECRSCGHTGFINIAVGSERKTASASGFRVLILATNELEIVCPDCDAVVYRIE